MKSYDKEETTFKVLIMEQLRRISKLGSEEWKGGYMATLTKQQGALMTSQEIYVADTRLIYCNAVYHLSSMLLPYYDDKMKEGYKERTESLEKLETIQDDEKFKKEKVKVFLELYIDLSKFLHRIDYLELQDVQDDDE